LPYVLAMEDNQAVEHDAFKNKARNPIVARMLRRWNAYLATTGCMVKVDGIATDENKCADLLSRQRIDEFLLIAKKLGFPAPVEIKIPAWLRDTSWITG